MIGMAARALVSGLAVFSPAVQGRAEPERYGMVITSGADTVAVERVTRDATSVRSEIFVPARARLEVSAAVGADGCVTGAVVSVFPWGAAPGGTPLQRVSVQLDGDTVRVDARAGDVKQALDRAFPGARAVLAGESDAVAALVLECALSAGADSADVPVVAFPGLRAMNVRVMRRGDAAVVITTDTVRAQLDPEGRPVRIDTGRGSRVITRVDARSIDALRFAAPDYSAPADAPYHAEDVTVDAGPDATLAGTLTLPSTGTGPFPAVVTVSGSGPQDRDSYAAIAGGWRPFRQFADTLSRRGVAVLRFDDRGVGGSTGDYGAGTERTAAKDALAVVAYLRTRPDIDAGHIVLLGHSEGVRIAMLAAAEDPAIAGLALLSGAADTRAASRAQALWLVEHGPQAGLLPRDSALARVDRQMDSLAVTGNREVYRWNAEAVARGIRARVAIFHGETDRQVPSGQADALAAVFRGAGNPDVTVRVFPGLNHLLVPDPSGDFLRYDRLESARVGTAVLGALADWMAGAARARAPQPAARATR